MESMEADAGAPDAGLRWWLALGALVEPRPSARGVREGIRAAGSPEAWLAGEVHAPAETVRGAGDDARPLRWLDRVDWGEVDRAEQSVREHGIDVVPFLSPWYPTDFHAVERSPLLLYLRGRIELLMRPAIGVVGTRAATAAGSEEAWRLGRELAEAGWVVVSGLARGVDAAAHQGALEARGDTVAVLGSGVDVVFPRRHRALQDEIARRGLLLSELPPGTPPRAAHFPQRNRLVGALARAIVVVEAPERSGALITAADARRLGRPVFAYPGPAGAPETAGTNAWLKRGDAIFVESSEDVLRRLAALALDEDAGAAPRVGEPDPATPADTRSGEGVAPRAEQEGAVDAVPERGREVWRRLGARPVSADLLARRLGVPVSRVLAGLLELELSGHAESLRGGTAWRRKRRGRG